MPRGGPSHAPSVKPDASMTLPGRALPQSPAASVDGARRAVLFGLPVQARVRFRLPVAL